MKYSAVILAFGEPLFRLLEPGTPRAVRRNAMLIVITTWNALVVDEALGTNDNVRALRGSLALMPEPGASLFGDSVEELIARKQSDFAEQRWTIGRWELLGDSLGELRLRVEVHKPPSRSAL